MFRQRGFTLIDIMVAIGIASGLLIVTAFSLYRPPRVHPAAERLQAALAEARSLAMTYGQVADAPNAGGPGTAGLDGATVTVTADPTDPGNSSIIGVYRSRPQVAAFPLAIDTGFPPVRVPVAFFVNRIAPRPFAILISSAGYADVALGFPNSLPPPNSLVNEPPCAEGAESITAASDGIQETDPFECREGILDTSTAGA